MVKGVYTLKDKQTYTCEICGDQYVSSPSRENNLDKNSLNHLQKGRLSGCCSSTCSSKKRHLTLDTVEKVCPTCGLNFYVPNKSIGWKRKFCSHECSWVNSNQKFAPVGERHWNWGGGSTPLALKIRVTTPMVKWTKGVKSRDHYICKLCKGIGCIAHHIKPFAQILEENNITTVEGALQCKKLFDLDNGITVCEGCHEKIHPWLKQTL